MSRSREFHDANGVLLAYVIERDLPRGLSACSGDNDFVQVLTWRYDRGRKLGPHIHNKVTRTADVTQECIVVISGSLRAVIYDKWENPVGSVIVNAGECLVLLAGGHGYEILDDDTQVFEIKNGPYPGAEADRRTFVPHTKPPSGDNA